MSTTDSPEANLRDESATDHTEFDFSRFTLRVDGMARRVHDDGDGWVAHERARLVCERPIRDLEEFLTLVGARRDNTRSPRDIHFTDEAVDYLLAQRDGYELGPHDPREWDVTVDATVGVWEDFLRGAADLDPDEWHGSTSESDVLSWGNNAAQGPVASPDLFLAIATLWGHRDHPDAADKRDQYVEQFKQAVSDDE